MINKMEPDGLAFFISNFKKVDQLVFIRTDIHNLIKENMNTDRETSAEGIIILTNTKIKPIHKTNITPMSILTLNKTSLL
jgi:hypothetical protein